MIEGSVQKIANAVHVNVQLIRAATDEHVWAESYNRKLDDVFAVEGEVASAIAEQFGLKLSGTEQKAVTAKPTENAAAYDAFLRGPRSNTAVTATILIKEPRGVMPKPSSSIRTSRWPGHDFPSCAAFFTSIRSISKTNSAEAVKTAADHALSLAPDLGESLVAQGSYRYRVLRDFEAALSSYKKAPATLPQ